MTRILDRLFRKPRPVTWTLTEDDLPWFDRADAESRLADRIAGEGIPGPDAEKLRSWLGSGGFVAEGLIDPSLADAVTADLARVWESGRPRPGLRILGTGLHPSDPGSIRHRRLMDLSPEKREEIRTRANWRIHNFHEHSENARAVREHPGIARLAALTLGRSAPPGPVINFMFGSRQGLHQDMAVFCVHPGNHLVGVWIALEDIAPDSGPLVYYPGSHREPMYHGFDNYPQTSLKTCSPGMTAAYDRHLAGLAEKYERREFLGRKGDAFFWHGMLLHGGSEVRNPAATRRSMVIHFIPEGMDVERRLVGPFNW